MSQTTSPGVPMTADSTDRDEGCVFCPIPPQAKILREWGQIVAFEPLNPVTPGHVLVVPRWHATDIGDNIYLSGNVMRCAAELAADLGACNVITSKGAAATQTVMHLHVHVVPRHEGDGLPLPWTPQQAHLRATGPARDEGVWERIEDVISKWERLRGPSAIGDDLRAALAASPAPARDEGLRERIEALRDNVEAKIAMSAVHPEWTVRDALQSVHQMLAALAASPAPGGDEDAADRAAVDASRAEGGPNVSLDDLKAELDAPGGDTGATASNWQPRWTTRTTVPPLAGGGVLARDGLRQCTRCGAVHAYNPTSCRECGGDSFAPVPPGPAATRDGEAGK